MALVELRFASGGSVVTLDTPCFIADARVSQLIRACRCDDLTDLFSRQRLLAGPSHPTRLLDLTWEAPNWLVLAVQQSKLSALPESLGNFQVEVDVRARQRGGVRGRARRAA